MNMQNKNNKKNLIFFFLLVLTVSFVSAIEPSQQYNKIYINPFYRENLVSNTNYTYNVEVFPADGITKVLNAVLSFNAQINGQTQNFTLWVSNTTTGNRWQKCNTPSYSIATAYSATGNAQFYFDCSNRIIKPGNYSVRLKSTVNTGAIQGWLDLTYMNNPVADMTIHGTEYTNDQIVKVWLQLLDNNGEYVNDGICYVDIYDPNNEQYLENTVMTSMAHDGVYYYDFEAPEASGVYPVIAKCYYESEIVKYYSTSFTIGIGASQVEIATETFESNTWTGGTGWSAGWTRTGNCIITTLSNPINTYQMRGDTSCIATRNFDDSGFSDATVSFYATATSLEAGEYCRYYYYNGATYSQLLQLADGVDDGTPDLYSYNVTSYGFNSNAGIRMQATSAASSDYCYMDNITITGVTNQNVGDLEATDGNSVVFVEQSVSGISRVNVTLNFNATSCKNVDQNLLIGLGIYVYGTLDSVPNDDILISIWNYTGNKWLDLPNRLLEGINFKSASNSISLINITSTGLINSTGNVKIKLIDSNYSDTTNNKLYLDEVYVGCEQASSPVWQEVKGSSEVHISAKNDIYPFYIQTLCGENNDENTCAEFVNDEEYWNYTWGYIYENITFINSYQSNIDSRYIYETQFSQDCTGIIDITSNDESIYDSVGISAGDKENCRISIPVLFNAEDRQFNIEIYQDNYMKWEFQKDKDISNYYNLVITPFCENIATINNDPYEVPIEGNIDISQVYINNPIYLGCYRAIDDLYWFNEYYNLSLDVTTAGEMESYLLEARFYFPLLRDHSNSVVQLAKEDIQLFDADTLCEKESGIEGPFENDFSCAKVMPPDDYFSSQEGYIFANITFTNIFSTNLEQKYIFESALGIDCTAIRDITEWKGDVSRDIYDEVIFKIGDKGNCKLTIPIVFLENETTSDIVIRAENYINWELFWANDLVENLNSTIGPYCDEKLAGISYTIPIANSSEFKSYLGNDSIVSCIRAKDDIYWFHYFYNQFPSIETVGPLESILSEIRIFYPYIINDYNTILAEIRSENQVSTLQAVQSLNFTSLNFTSPGISFIGGTEYIPNDNGKISVRLVKSNGDAETGASCKVTILYPDMSMFVNNTNMTEYGEGIYDYNFIVPSIEGIYPYYTDCIKVGQKYKALSTFHVSNILATINSTINRIEYDIIFINSTTISINNTLTSLNDYVMGSITSTLAQINAILLSSSTTGNKIFYFSNITSDIPRLMYTNLTVPRGQKASYTMLSTNTEKTIASWISPIISTNYTVISGMRTFYIAAKVDNVLYETRLRGLIYTTNLTGGNLTILRTSELSAPLTLTESVYHMTVMGNEWVVPSDIRILFNITAVKDSAFGTAYVTVYADDDTYSRLEVPTPSLNLDVDVATNLTEVYTQLGTLQILMQQTKDFTAEQVYLITDSMTSIKELTKDKNISNSEVETTLLEVKSNLQNIGQINLEKELVSTKQEIKQTINPFQIIIIGIITTGIILILIMKKKKQNRINKERLEKIEKEKIKQEELK
jgi:hypothetical protein